MDVLDAIKNRKSVRAFLDKDVDNATIRAVLDAARWAPSGANAQPWKVAVVKGRTKEAITRAILEAKEKGIAVSGDYSYYPEKWRSPYKKRRFECGLALYGAMGIDRKDAEARKEAWFNNYRFFGAPVGLFFFMPKCMGTGYLVDMGVFIQTVVLAAAGHGLATCIQASLAEHPDIIRQILDISDEFSLICAVSMGYEDETAPCNRFRQPRIEVDEFTSWYD